MGSYIIICVGYIDLVNVIEGAELGKCKTEDL